MCPLSRVTCHVSRVTVTCHVSHGEKKSGQSGKAFRWRVCYQRGLPRLVSMSKHLVFDFHQEKLSCNADIKMPYCIQLPLLKKQLYFNIQILR